jgi:hypothetical protein
MRLLHDRITIALLTVGLSAGTMAPAASAMHSAPYPSNTSLPRPVSPEPSHTSTRIISLSRLVNLELTPASSPSSTNLCAELCTGAIASPRHGSVAQLPPALRPHAAVLAEQRFVNAAPATARNSGFEWGAAGIGVGACLVLLAIGLARTRTATNGRRRRPAEQRTIATL